MESRRHGCAVPLCVCVSERHGFVAAPAVQYYATEGEMEVRRVRRRRAVSMVVWCLSLSLSLCVKAVDP